ncbi:hypothetical protein H6F67_18950 [Microcoleus sp. FACHB-1515]|uniref:hypothetical protein n=1 Tax=Cyanophyceae TaxID=3028117 RepID=UPI001682E5F9|nr:hypothetical protein [Microcoleus sp. FACHB-1515]MBD2091927.1 hypothetical protein [Microcoleus sp. FACHB-1515]
MSRHTKTALLTALSFVATSALPFAAVASEPMQVAQLFPQEQVGLPTGTTIAVRYDEAERIIVTPEETAPVTLIVAQDVRSASGTVLIRSGSTIAGELRPDGDGTRFFAETLTPAGSTRSISIDATSGLITERETITRESNPDFLRGAAIGAAAGAVIGEIFGSIDFGEVLLGAGVGTLASVLLRGREEVEVVVVNPATDLTLTLQSNFVLR